MIHSFQPEYFKNLDADIFKYKQHGPPRFRINVPCKFMNDCKYGKFSCEYSHEPFCKYTKNGKKCLNSYCTLIHELPMEFQLAQQVLYLENQLSLKPECTETQNSASTHHFSSSTLSKNGTSGSYDLRYKKNDFSTESHESSPKINVLSSIQPSKQAETSFTAFSLTIHNTAKKRKQLLT